MMALQAPWPFRWRLKGCIVASIIVPRVASSKWLKHVALSSSNMGFSCNSRAIISWYTLPCSLEYGLLGTSGGGSIGTLDIFRMIYAKVAFRTAISLLQTFCIEETYFMTFTFLVILGTDGRGPSLWSHKYRHCSLKVCKVVVKFMFPRVRGRPVAS